MKNPTGAELLVRALKAAGVDCAFMTSHAGTASIEEAITTEGSIRVIFPVSETSCVPMADGYTRYSGKPAAAITPGGGHALNQAVGIASAWADKSPVISIGVCDDDSGHMSPVFDRERWSQAQAFEAVTRWSARIGDWDAIPGVAMRAVREALSRRCGPVHIEVPRHLLETRRDVDDGTLARLRRSDFHAQEDCPPEGDPDLVRVAYDLLNRASKPLMLIGGGAVRAGAAPEANELAEKLKIPVTSTMGGMGAAFPDNPAYLGPPSYLSGEAFHTAIREADVVLSLGCCFSGLDGFGLPPLWSSKIKFIQVNIDHEDIALNPAAEVAIVGDAKKVTRQLLELASRFSRASDTSAWLAKIRRLNQEHLDRINDEANRPWDKIHPGVVPPILDEIAHDAGTAVVLDGGNTALWAGMLIPVPGPRRGFFPIGMGTLGVSIPCAIGIKAAAGDTPVTIFSGDGAFLYNMHEIETMRKYDMPIVSVIMNDSAWNMIRAGQAMAGTVFGTDLPDQDYGAVARSYGILGRRVTRKEEIGPAFREAFESGRPAVIDIVVDPDSLPDSLISFARVEFAGAKMPPGRLIDGMRKSNMKLDVRAWNLLKFISKSR